MGTNGKLENIIKATLADEVAAVIPEISQRDAARVVDSIVRTMRDTLAKGEEIKISGFGKFTLQDKKSRMGRNPQTGESIAISARRVLKFRPSEVLRERLNNNLPGEVE